MTPNPTIDTNAKSHPAMTTTLEPTGKGLFTPLAVLRHEPVPKEHGARFDQFAANGARRRRRVDQGQPASAVCGNAIEIRQGHRDQPERGTARERAGSMTARAVTVSCGQMLAPPMLLGI